MNKELKDFIYKRHDNFDEKVKDILRPFMKQDYDLLVCSRRIIALVQ